MLRGAPSYCSISKRPHSSSGRDAQAGSAILETRRDGSGRGAERVGRVAAEAQAQVAVAAEACTPFLKERGFRQRTPTG